MNEKLKNTVTTVKEKWGGLSKVAKVLLITVPAAIIAIIIVIVILLNQKDHAVLFSGVNNAEAGEIATAIMNLGVTDVKVESDGDIIVPEDQVDYLRMQMYMQGYPTSSTDYEIWNTGVDLWSTDADKREVKRQQLETRIGAALATLDDVREATVTLVLPEISDYVIDTGKGVSSCSVILRLKDGAALSNAEVRAIYQAVKTSAENLTNDNISILDTTGKMYTWVNPEDDLLADEDASGVEIAQRRFQFQQEFEDKLSEGLGKMFDKVYGEKNYAFNVTAILNYDQKTVDEEEYIPDGDTHAGVIEHEKDVTEGGYLGTEDGVVGVTPNADSSPDYPEIIGLEDGQNYYYSSSETQYKVSNIKTSLIKDGYSIEKLSVALMINETSMTEAEREALCDIVAKASGTDIANVAVYNTPFALSGSSGGTTIGSDDGLRVITPEDTYRDMLLFIVIGLGVLLIVLLIVSLFMSSSRKKKIRRRQEAALAAAGSQYENMGSAQAPEPIEEVDINIASLTEEAGKDTRETILKREISEFAKTNPEIVASIIKNLLREE